MTPYTCSTDAIDRLIALRRDLNAHPELSYHEHRTTRVVAEFLQSAGLDVHTMPAGTGLWCDIGPIPPSVALRADIDALPIGDTKDAPYRSVVDGAAHACGHDVHTAVLVGVALALDELNKAEQLPHGVRLIFQHAEEDWPGGAVEIIEAGGLAGIERIFALHCDPSFEVGEIGLRVGAVTGASDHIEVNLAGPGGHSARGHLTADLVAALGALAVHVPALLARRVDARTGTVLVWGHINAGSAPNAIPKTGLIRGRIRTLSRDVWGELPPLVEELITSVAKPYGVDLSINHIRGVPPVVNDERCIGILSDVVACAVTGGVVRQCPQSLGGEDFAWYVDRVPGAFLRLGVAAPGSASTMDLHQSDFDVDETCIPIGVQTLVGAALAPL